MVSTHILKRQGGAPFAAEESIKGAAIIKDLEGRSGAVKVAEVDDGIVLDAVALAVGPDGK